MSLAMVWRGPSGTMIEAVELSVSSISVMSLSDGLPRLQYHELKKRLWWIEAVVLSVPMGQFYESCEGKGFGR